jgi:hypothetical protein
VPAGLPPRAQPSTPGRGGTGLRAGAGTGVRGLVVAAARAGAREPAARADLELHLVRLIKDMGVNRALALLPVNLARAVRAIRAVARLLGQELER